MSKYDSAKEAEFHKKYPKLKYHVGTIELEWTKKYTPDFNGCVEFKGRFRNSDEAKKCMLASKVIKNYCMIFQVPEKPMPGAKVRKDGTRQTHADWADKNGIPWYTIESFKEVYKKYA